MTKAAALEEDLFAAALALPASEWSGYLNRACGEDRALQARVRTLLNAFEGAEQFVKESALRDNRCADIEALGTQIGSYRLLEPLGEGGCGVVYRAEQLAPVQREVALKVIKLGMDTRAVLARFQTERQVLALMDHPNIARVFDAGATPTGRPYFVMEWVRGVPITQYCDQSLLNIAERLALFIQVCHAIQHAHHQGIIHRDIKPSNVLVTLHEGEPHVKVIDFGIAKATQGRLTDQTALTLIDHFIGTPAYVSPEQTEPGGLRVDTRSDLYSLGVLLYELLTGCTPFESEELLRAGLDRMKQRVREEEPPTPSKRLGTLTDAQAIRTAVMRQARNATALTNQLRGDLDWIVMRCLEKDRTRRYPSAHELATDLQRYLQHEPVSARPPSLSYMMGKWTRRHRLLVASAALILVVLLVATFVSVTLAIRATHAEQLALQAKQQAQRERASAEQASQFMLELVSSADPFVSFGKNLTGSELLERAERSLREQPNQPPQTRAQLLQAIGRAYRRQGQPGRAVDYLKSSLTIREQLPAESAAQTGSVLTELAIALREEGRLEESDSFFQRALKISQHSTGERTSTHARLLVDLGRLELQRGNLDKTEHYLRRGLALTRELQGPHSPEVAEILLCLSSARAWRDDLESAEGLAREAVTIYSKSVPELHPDRVTADSRLGEMLLFRGRLDEAAEILERTLATRRLIFGNHNRIVAETLDILSGVRLAQNRIGEAHKAAAEAVEISKALGDDNYLTGYLQSSFAQVLTREKQFDLAEKNLREALGLYAKSLPPDHLYVASAEYWLSEVLLATNRLSDAEATLIASMDRLKRTEASAWRIARSASALGEVRNKQGHAAEAEKYLLDGYRGVATAIGADEDTKRQTRQRLVRFYTDRGERHKLDEWRLATKDNVADKTVRSN